MQCLVCLRTKFASGVGIASGVLYVLTIGKERLVQPMRFCVACNFDVVEVSASSAVPMASVVCVADKRILDAIAALLAFRCQKSAHQCENRLTFMLICLGKGANIDM